MKVLCFGNEFLEEDCLAKEIADEIKLSGMEFIKCNSPEEILNYKGEKIVILDVAKGIEKVLVLEDTNKIKNRNISTLHDFDLGFFLQLMEKTGTKANAKIICIPQKGDKEKIIGNVRAIIGEMMRKD